VGNPKGIGRHWPRLSIRTSLVLVWVGLSFEVLVVLNQVIIEYFRDRKFRLLGLKNTALFAGNSIIGLIGTLILCVGIVALIRILRVSRRAAGWRYAGVAMIISFKVLDVINSFHYLYFRDLLGVEYDVDTLVMNVLLIGSAASMLIAMMSALFDLFKVEQELEERNLALDREIHERRLFTTAIQNAAESIMITDAAGAIQYVNPAFEKLTKFKLGEVKGRNPNILKSGKHDNAFYKELWDTICAGKVWRGRLTNKRKDGELFTEDAAISPIQNEQGVTTHFVAVKRDVTRERLLEQQVLQSQKLEAVGTLAGGIAHDLNNVLAVIIGHSEISMGHLEPDHPVRKSLEVIMRTADRSSQLIKRLLIFSRQGVSEPSPLEPAPLLKEQMKVIRSYLPSNIAISDFIDMDAGFILGEPIEIQQILFNLCTNANHAMQPEGGSLEIRLDAAVIMEERVVNAGILKPGEYVHLSVTDSGCGMEESVLKRIFEPFFTTKDVGMGTGLGLPMVHGSVTRSGGAIEVSSVLGKGSKFDVYWPQLVYEVSEVKEPAELPKGDGRMVLIVDDMVDFKELLEANLTVHGFRTAGFIEVNGALDFFRKNSGQVDIALVDYMMPGMNGNELAERLHEIRPDLPVVLVSGYSSSVTEENATEYGFAAAISKPVETAHLLHTISKCLS